MTEDQILQASITFLEQEGWTTIYRTRPNAEGAIGGVDAIFIKYDSNHILFLEAKADSNDGIKRSGDFSNALGTILKRIRFESGYSGVEAIKRFIPIPQHTQRSLKNYVKKHGLHKNSTYVLAFEPGYAESIKQFFDPSLAALLNVKVLMVTQTQAYYFNW
jgi:hypothetical protein